MAHIDIGDEQTRTSFEGAPDVSIVNVENGETTLSISLHAEPINDKHESLHTVITFGKVRLYSFHESAFGGPPENPRDRSLRLIEVTDSELKAWHFDHGFREMVEQTSPFGERPAEADYRHYRIVFDEHGTYDVICLDLDIRQELRPVG